MPIRPTAPGGPNWAPAKGRERVAVLDDVIARLLPRPAANADLPPEAHLTNVIQFARMRRETVRVAPPVAISRADRMFGAISRNRGRLLLLLVCSAAAHVALTLPFMRAPDPMASIGEQVISAEIVVGADEDAGLLRHGGNAESSAPDPVRTPEPEPEQPKPVELAEAPPLEVAPVTPPDVSQVRPMEAQAAPAETATVRTPTEAPPSVALQAPAEALPDQPQAPAEIQAAPMTPTEAAAELQAAVNPELSTETQVAPPQEATPLPQPAPPKPARAAPKPTPPKEKPPREVAKPKPRTETRRANAAGAPNESTSTAAPSVASGGVGRGRSDSHSNYPGLVAAQIRRNLQFPSDARSRGITGSATVSFGVSGSGSVTSVRLVRGTGVASLDAEATAVVRRASPFPAPPGGQAQSFTVPIGFRLN